MSTNPALASAHGVFEAINTRDLSRLADYVTEDFVDHGSPFPLPPGPEGYRQILTYVTQVLRFSYEVVDEIVTPDRIVFRAIGHGHAVAALHGPEAAGRPYTMHTVHVYRTEGRRLAEHWGVRDELGVLIELGLAPAPDPAVVGQLLAQHSQHR